MTTDKLDAHYFHQLSALMDGDLPPDQARFLLRRLEHDIELTGCWDRWQLCGEVLRGQAQAPAPAGFADRVAALVALDAPAAASAESSRKRSLLARWGGGALAASVAAIALFMVRQQVPDEAPAAPAPTIAGQSPEPVPATAAPASPALQAAATVTAASVAVASVPRRATDSSRRSATRNQQAARNAAASRAISDRPIAALAAVPVVHAIAATPVAGSETDPFSGAQINPPAARPWPRAVLPNYASGGYNADYSTDRAAQTFYPFEPRLPVNPPVAVPETEPRDR